MLFLDTGFIGVKKVQELEKGLEVVYAYLREELKKGRIDNKINLVNQYVYNYIDKNKVILRNTPNLNKVIQRFIFNMDSIQKDNDAISKDNDIIGSVDVKALEKAIKARFYNLLKYWNKIKEKRDKFLNEEIAEKLKEEIKEKISKMLNEVKTFVNEAYTFVEKKKNDDANNKFDDVFNKLGEIERYLALNYLDYIKNKIKTYVPDEYSLDDKKQALNLINPMKIAFNSSNFVELFNLIKDAESWINK
jgi:hypothetical protein